MTNLSIYATKASVDLEDNLVHLEGITLSNLASEFNVRDLLDEMELSDIESYLKSRLDEYKHDLEVS